MAGSADGLRRAGQTGGGAEAAESSVGEHALHAGSACCGAPIVAAGLAAVEDLPTESALASIVVEVESSVALTDSPREYKAGKTGRAHHTVRTSRAANRASRAANTVSSQLIARTAGEALGGNSRGVKSTVKAVGRSHLAGRTR